MIGTVVLLVFLLILSGFFSGAEIALFSLREPRVRALVRKKRPGARALERLKRNPERLLITILIGNNVANIGAAAVATYTATELFGSAGVGLATGVMTLLVLFFGEITPKSFAARNADRLSLLAAPFLSGLGRLLLPVAVPLEWLVRRVLPDTVGRTHVSEWEIRAMVRLGHQSGDIETHERQFIDRVFTLDRLRAREIMTPRVDILAWEDARHLGDIAEALADIRFSRIPVYGESLDDVTGVLYRTEAYQALLAGRRGVTLASLAREPYFVPDTITLIELLEQFRARRVHMGLVVDEHGGLDGLVTLEDILEELVGDIVDETDVPPEPIIRLRRDEIAVDAGAELREINDFFGTSLPVAEHRSLNGFLLGELGRVPEAGEVVEHGDVRIQVVASTDTQVTRARIRRR
ncbi:hemolysin family protein [Candidatus Palauibacter sp.]|uniref:hemolysin family protein n=1 Tax=Candidatus Palauibacter sp. TaxID=3101350 RepID=UPI003B517ED2